MSATLRASWILDIRYLHYIHRYQYVEYD
jgi:hypothetical protein